MANNQRSSNEPPASSSFTSISHESDVSNDARTHIERIRRNLGADNTLNKDGQSIVSNLHGVLQRSLEKLSTDLYSEEGHFVLELIQNADDNHYEIELPSLRFIISKERVLVCNNETGFSADNISAICNVGASTKGKHKKGYTGHKGIGFKSVFMVSHKPEVHSNDYHIRFDTHEGQQQMGYILPIWLNQFEENLSDLNEWRTCIRLPLRSDVRIDNLQKKFANIEPKLLLFLNRLKQIEFIDELDNNLVKKTFRRIDHADGEIIELQEQISNDVSRKNFWLVVKQVIDVPEDIKVI